MSKIHRGREVGPQSESGANPGYVVAQLARAVVTSREHADAATRARAAAKVERWTGIFEGMLGGRLDVGSRAPVAGLPPWVTLEVVKGGFATGNAIAGGPLAPHELELGAELGIAEDARARAALNVHYLGEAGQAALLEMLRDRRYRVQVPEEAALPVLAWLLAHGKTEEAHALLDAIAPFVDRLRFHPARAATPLAPAAVVRLETVAETLGKVRQVRTSARVETMNEALRFWAPLSDRAAALWLETVEGPWPSVRRGPDGEPLRRPDRNHEVEGGFPGARFPEGWHARARALLDEYAALRGSHQKSGKPDRAGESFARLRGALERAVRAGGTPLPRKEAAGLRAILAGVLAKRGAPGSPELSRLREIQARVAAAPTNGELASVVATRLASHPQDGGLGSVDGLLAPVTEAETRAGVPAGAAMPEHLRDKLQRCLEAPVDVLVELGVIPSAEVLARVVPQMTSEVRAAGFADPELRTLYSAVYAAFRRRRSLLLLDLASQVKLEELPWVAAIEPLRRGALGDRELSRQTLEQLSSLTFASFPHVIVPNKLLQELRALAKGAGMPELPLVDELAADIFMGAFSLKFLEAARTAARLLRGTLYERYYGLPFDRVLELDDLAVAYRTPVSPGFAALCQELAAPQQGDRGSVVARAGTVIEQQQILTTQNLAVLFQALGLARLLGPRLPELSRQCFTWVCARQRTKIDDWQSRLQMVKNTAYAFRQMIFYLSLCSRGDLEDFLAWAEAHLAAADEAFRARFAPAVEGLRHVAGGGTFTGRAGEGRRFLGWTMGKHWLMA